MNKGRSCKIGKEVFQKFVENNLNKGPWNNKKQCKTLPQKKV